MTKRPCGCLVPRPGHEPACKHYVERPAGVDPTPPLKPYYKQPTQVGRRVCIVFEEGLLVDGGAEFKVYLEGISQEDKERLKNTPEDNWPTTELWAIKSFTIVQDILRKTGAFRSVTRKNPAGKD